MIFRRLCAALIGIVFIFSAAFKLIDPTGTGLVVEAYFKFLHLDFLKECALAAGEALSVVEMVVGIGLVSGVYRRFFALVTLGLLAFFTLISTILLVFNPEMSCGCFGQVLELTHFQTFCKNIVLDFLALRAFFPLCYLGYPGQRKLVAFWTAICLAFFFATVFLVQTSTIEFTEYRPSNTIVLESETGNPAKGYDSPSLPLWNSDGEDCSGEILDGDVMVISVYAPEELSQSDVNATAVFAQNALNAGYSVAVLSVAPLEIPGVETYMSDYRTLITFNRSNGGAVYLSDGYIVRKFSAWHLPDYDGMAAMSDENPTDLYVNAATAASISLQVFAFLFFALLLLL